MAEQEPGSGLSDATAWRARYALGLLLLVHAVAQIDRNLLQILVHPVGRELGASDTQMGLLVGTAFTVFYTVAGLPLARWADRGSRKTIIIVALTLWSAMTAFSGLARHFAMLLVARIGVAVGEAGCTPPAHSMLADHFPAGKRGIAFSIYALGSPIGLLIGMGGGGWIAQEYGWRVAFYVAGVPGLVLACVVGLTLREPARGQSDTAVATAVGPSMRETLAFMWRLRALRHLLIASSLHTFSLAAAGAWQPALMIRLHGLELGQVGLYLGSIAGLGGGLGVFLGGWLGDRLARRDPRWYLWLPALGGLGALPFLLGFYLTSSTYLALGLLLPATLLQFIYAGIQFSTAQSLVKLRMRATMSAIMLLAVNIIGSGGGPQVAGIVNDLLAHRFGEEAVRSSLLLLSCGLPWAGLHFVLAARTYRQDLAAKGQD